MKEIIKSPLGLINHKNLQSDEVVLLTLNYEMFEDKKLLIKKGDYLIVSSDYYSKMKKIRRYTQSEYPLTALPWIIDRIENGFFKTKVKGDFQTSSAVRRLSLMERRLVLMQWFIVVLKTYQG